MAKELERAQLYCNVMEEIKIRIAAIDAGTANKLSVLPPAIVREHCHLQLRLICELIALGCLIAHGDIQAPQIKKLQKQWQADKIMEELSKLHPEFYPVTVVQTRSPGGTISITNAKPQPLPKDELIKMYGKCGDILHRGSAKKFLSQKGPIVVHYPDITKLAQKIVDLLSVHMIVMRGAEKIFICVLHDTHHNGLVSVATVERPIIPIPLKGPASPLRTPV